MIFLEGESRMSAKLTNKETTQQQYVPWRVHTQDKEASRPDRLDWPTHVGWKKCTQPGTTLDHTTSSPLTYIL